jgi:Cu+-exporting ATPase
MTAEDNLTKKKVKKVDLKISGMSCATCASTIKKSLLNLDHVSKAEVNLGNEFASVEYNPTKLKLTDLEKAITDSGYQVVNNKVVLKIGGMTCAMCVKTIEEALKKLDGITNVNVNLGSEKAYVTYNQRITTISDMKKAIEDAGYQFFGIVGEETEELEKKAIEKNLKQKSIRIVIGFVIGIPLMIFMYYHPHVSMELLSYISLLIATPTFVYISYPIFRAGYRAIRNKNLDMDVMYSLGIGVAYVSSVMGTFEIILTREFIFYETAVLLATFLTFGRYLETKAKGKTSEAIKKLMKLQPKTATVFRNDEETEILIEDVQVDDIIIVKPGEKIPVDGIIVEGQSYVDESMITGESIPVLKKKDDSIIGGTINKNSIIKFKATKIGKDTVLSQIIALVEDAQESKPHVQRIADLAVSYFIPIVLTIAIVSFIIWYVIFGAGLLFSLTALISVLVIACPCALGLATPTAITVGIGRGAELGVLIRNGEVLEISERLTTIIFDKTGTITKGKPEVTDVISFDVKEDELLKIAASVEKNSQHPLAEAVFNKASEKAIELLKITDFDTYEGKGVKAKIGKKEVFVGNRLLLNENNISIPQDIDKQIISLETQGKTAILVANDKKIIGIIAIADTVKEKAKETIEKFKKMSMKILMITGDNKRSAQSIARQVGINNVLSEVLPQDKVNEVKKLQEKKEIVAFIGDGINDAPALTQADIGIAIGSGTDVAIESGDIVLIKDDLRDSVNAIKLSKKVMSRIKQNLFWAFAYNAALIPVAAGVLYPLYNITFRPEFAGLAMALSSVTVVTLSLLLKRYKP